MRGSPELLALAIPGQKLIQSASPVAFAEHPFSVDSISGSNSGRWFGFVG